MSDPGVKIETVYALAQKLNDLGKHIQLKAYWGTRHAFTLPGGSDYVPEHADDALREAVLFIRRTFSLPVGTVAWRTCTCTRRIAMARDRSRRY